MCLYPRRLETPVGRFHPWPMVKQVDQVWWGRESLSYDNHIWSGGKKNPDITTRCKKPPLWPGLDVLHLPTSLSLLRIHK